MMRGIWDRETVALMLIAALMPVALAWLWFGGAEAGARLLFTLAISGVWHLIFMLLRAQRPSFSVVIFAFSIAMFSPENLTLFQMVLGISFGIVMAELVFGGWGRNVLNPGTITLAFLGFSFPAAPWPEILLPVAWAAIPTAFLGVVLGLMPSRVILSTVAVLALGWILGAGVEPVLIAAMLVLVVLVSDPVTSASTHLGGLLYGLAYGGLVILFSNYWLEAAPMQLCISAALLTTLAAPLFDETAISVWLAQRKRRHG